MEDAEVGGGVVALVVTLLATSVPAADDDAYASACAPQIDPYWVVDSDGDGLGDLQESGGTTIGAGAKTVQTDPNNAD